jgi:hypothetical protein
MSHRILDEMLQCKTGHGGALQLGRHVELVTQTVWEACPFDCQILAHQLDLLFERRFVAAIAAERAPKHAA